MHVLFESADLEKLNQPYVARGLAPTAVRKSGAGNLLFTMQESGKTEHRDIPNICPARNM